MADEQELAEEERGVSAEDRSVSVTASAALMSVLVVLSRVTGFARTWAQAFGMGATVLASCYELANNLPTQIYELVTAGMLVTAFLPAYLSVKKRLGREGSNAYVSNLTSIVVVLTGAITLLSFIFAAQIIWTQSFSAAADFDSARAVWFFRFFVIEIVLYALSTIFSGVLNAERDYLWSSAAPIFNNIVVMSSFIAYGFLADKNPQLALLILAVGNPLGVLIQVVLQIPAMRRHGIRFTWRIDLRDPALKDTLKIGLPTVIIMVLGFVTNSFHMNAFLSFTAIGASIGSYALLWYNLPYAVFCVPIMTVLFTELADYYASGDMDSFRDTVAGGIGRIFFLLIPFAAFLAVFSDHLVTVVSASRFSPEAAELCSYYLSWRAFALPVYGVGMFLQKVCSSTRKMEVLVAASAVGSAVQIFCVQFIAPKVGLWMVPFSSFLFYVALDVIVLISLRNSYGRIGLARIASGVVRSAALAAVGCGVALGVLHLVQPLVGGGPVIHAVLMCVIAGVPALIATYGCAIALKVPEASTVTLILDRLLKKARS